MDWEFEAEVFQWRGPAPHYFVAAPSDVDDYLHAHHGELTYGWGVIPAQVRIGATEVTTSLIPKDGVYLVPLKLALRRPEGVDDGDRVHVRLQVGGQRAAGSSRTPPTSFVIDAPVAVKLAVDEATIPPHHRLTAPTVLRSQVLSLVYDMVYRGEIAASAGKKTLERIRGLQIRLLGDRSLEGHAWQLAVTMNWPDIHQAQYIALTQLQADALVTVDDQLAAAAREFVTTATLADVLGERGL